MSDTIEEICKLLEPFNSKGITLAPDTDISTDLRQATAR